MILSSEYTVQNLKVIKRELIEQFLKDCKDVQVSYLEKSAVDNWVFRETKFNDFDHVSGRKFLAAVHFQQHLQKLMD